MPYVVDVLLWIFLSLGGPLTVFAASPEKSIPTGHIHDLPVSAQTPGVTERTIPGTVVTLRRFTFGRNTDTEPETLAFERVIVVSEGNITVHVEGRTTVMSAFDCLYLEPGNMISVETGDETAEIIAVDFHSHAVNTAPSSAQAHTTEPSAVPGVPFSCRELMFSRMDDNVWSRLIHTRYGQVSFDRITPGGTYSLSSETESIAIVLAGEVDFIVVGQSSHMQTGEAVILPEGHPVSFNTGQRSVELLTVNAPHSPRYMESYNRQFAKLRRIIPDRERPVLVLDGAVSKPGLTTTEGPSWYKGAFYFSNYYSFQGEFAVRDEGGLCRLNADGSHRVLNAAIQTCGTTPLPNGNLAACDLIGRRVVEMSPAGSIVGVIADSYNGIPLGMPNDCITDSKGGLYFTDPRVANEEPRQPGSVVYYVAPDGVVRPVTAWNEFNRPNGCLVSADNSTFYLSCSSEDFIWMFDIAGDGSLINKRVFAKLIPPEFPHDKDRRRGTADGLTMDREGNIYAATNFGIQIFDRTGDFIGNVWLPVSPAHCVFGGAELSTLYATCKDRIYTLQINAHGYEYPLK